METIDGTVGRDKAAADLAAVAAAQRAVRDQPWPIWLYPANAVLLATMALTPMLSDAMKLMTCLPLAAVVFGLNYWVGLRIGTPFALPTSRGFLTAVVIAGLILIAAVLAGSLGAPNGIFPLLAVGVAVSYGIGSILHYRSTH
ncbi:hypothetical protein ACFQ3B_02415 [Stackebrandtia endophytica]|nr:hypothetical protein [Stackebrandtia endophytica]